MSYRAELVTLTTHEWRYAAAVGIERHINRRSGGFAQSENGYEKHVRGACAEMAVAKWLNVFWKGALVDDPRENRGDVQDGVEVRSTAHPDGRLLIREKDDPDSMFILAVGEPPKFELVGWIYAGEAPDLAQLRPLSPGSDPVWAVDQQDLRPMSELRRELARRAR